MKNLLLTVHRSSPVVNHLEEQIIRSLVNVRSLDQGQQLRNTIIFPYLRKSYFDFNIIARILRCFFLRIIWKRMSTEAHVYLRCYQDAKVKHFDVSNLIYHKFSYCAASYTLNGKTVNVTLELRNNFFFPMNYR